MATSSGQVRRARSDILRVVPIAMLLATGLLQLSLIAVSLADWAFGFGKFPGGEGWLLAFTLSSALTLAGGLGMAMFALARMPRHRLASLRRRIGRAAGGTIPGAISSSVVSWFEAHPSPSRTHRFRTDAAHLAFAIVCAAICMALAFAGIVVFEEKVAWFFPLSAFFLSMPIAFFWLSHASGGRPLPAATVLWGLSAGVMCAIPAVLLEVYFSRAAWLVIGLFGSADATVMGLVDGAIGASLVEEGVKAAAVLLLVYLGKASSRREGFALGLCVGLGFAFYENALYDLSGLLELSPILLLRPVSMALHMLGPAIVGAAVGGFRWGGAEPRLALAGLAGAIAVHSAWNGLIGGLPYLSRLSILLSGSEQALLLTVFAHLFVTPLLLSGALYVAGRRLAR